MMKKFIKFFETKFGWFFVNGHKYEKFQKHLEQKYGKQ